MSRLPQSEPPVTARLPVRRLPEALVDQIAAGEVVERPASVVKELVENAVDAGARRLGVEVRDGGAALVAVSDDGLGMTAEDARMALERHATSKLREAGDLFAIRSFGFRGEALPAIASVSRFRLRTRARGHPEAVELLAEGGRVEGPREAAGPEGTRVEVADLFAQLPARRKFLKSAPTEWGHVADWLGRAALALPGVHFEVRRDDRPALAWPAVSDPLERIAAVLSERDAAALERTEREAGGLRLRAFASRPDVHRATAAGIHLFVNGRPVRDRLLRHALLHVYRDVLPRGRFPTALLFLDVPPEAVDVNVHPAKWEVRFAEPQAIHRLVTAVLGTLVERRGWLARDASAGATPDRVADAGRAPGASGERSRARALPGDWLFAGRAVDDLVAAPAAPAFAAERASGAEEEAALRPLRFGALRLLGQLLATYLLVEAKDGLLLVDQHAAHERVLFERLRAGFEAEGVARQGLLVPATLELEPAALAALASAAEDLLALGYEVEPFGERTLAVRAVPELLADRDPLGALRALVEERGEAALAEGAPAPGAGALGRVDRLFATVACHGARRAGEVLDPREQQALLDALDAIPWAPTCPHGRPVAVPVTRGEIERRFGRR